MGILGVILAILAVVCGLAAPLFFGTTGAIVAGVLAAAAIVLGFLKRNKEGKGGIAPIVIGALALIMAFSVNSAVSSMFKELHKRAVELKPDGLWAQVSEDTNGGMMGLIKNLPQDEATINALMDEMNELNKLSESK